MGEGERLTGNHRKQIGLGMSDFPVLTDMRATAGVNWAIWRNRPGTDLNFAALGAGPLAPPLRIAELVLGYGAAWPLEFEQALEVVIAANVDPMAARELIRSGPMRVTRKDKCDALAMTAQDRFQGAIAGKRVPEQPIGNAGRTRAREAQAVEGGMVG